MTIDAMGCQKKIAGNIVESKGDYVLALKKNHRDLLDDIKLFFDEQIQIQNNPALGLKFICFAPHCLESVKAGTIA